MPKKKPSMNGESFGARLAQVRKNAGLSQRDLAAHLGISARMVAYYEAQTDHPPTHLLPALTELLGVGADELLGIKPLKEAKPNNQRLWRRFRQIEKLPPRDRRQLLGVIDAFLDAKKAS